MQLGRDAGPGLWPCPMKGLEQTNYAPPMSVGGKPLGMGRSMGFSPERTYPIGAWAGMDDGPRGAGWVRRGSITSSAEQKTEANG
jgi:hypothetical protein